MIGCNGTAALTSVNNGAVCQLNEKLDHPLQRPICMQQCNELHMRHIFILIDGKTTSLRSFPGSIDPHLVSSVLERRTLVCIIFAEFQPKVDLRKFEGADSKNAICFCLSHHVLPQNKKQNIAIMVF